MVSKHMQVKQMPANFHKTTYLCLRFSAKKLLKSVEYQEI